MNLGWHLVTKELQVGLVVVKVFRPILRGGTQGLFHVGQRGINAVQIQVLGTSGVADHGLIGLNLALDAIHYRDYPLLQGYVLFLGGIYVLVTLAVDLVLARMDPRIVLGGGD